MSLDIQEMDDKEDWFDLISQSYYLLLHSDYR